MRNAENYQQGLLAAMQDGHKKAMRDHGVRGPCVIETHFFNVLQNLYFDCFHTLSQASICFFV